MTTILITRENLPATQLTQWGRVTHTCGIKLNIIGSDNGLSPGRRQAITWTNAGILLIWPLGTNFSEMLIEIHTFSFKKMHLKMSSAKRRPFCLGLNVLMGSFPVSLSILYCLEITTYILHTFVFDRFHRGMHTRTTAMSRGNVMLYVDRLNGHNFNSF